MDFNEILEKRRAINFFDAEQDVSEEILRAVIADATCAPSSFNLQPWKMIILRSAEHKEMLKKLAMGQPKVSEAPVVIILLADCDGWKEGNSTLEQVFADSMQEDQREWFLGATGNLYGRSDEAALAFANKNAGLFAMSLMYSASNKGLHTHPMDGFDHDAVKKAFHIPSTYWIPMLIAVGYKRADVEIQPRRWRQSYEDMVLTFSE
jgi:nitroreductase